jgi:thiamine pyrophosphokinase
LKVIRYPLSDYDLTPENSIGISNVAVCNTAKNKLKKGILLCCEYNKEFNKKTVSSLNYSI